MRKATLNGMLWIVALACCIPRLAAAQPVPVGDELLARLAGLEEQTVVLRSQVDTQQKALAQLQTSLEAAQKRIHFLEITLLSPKPGGTAQGHQGSGRRRH